MKQQYKALFLLCLISFQQISVFCTEAGQQTTEEAEDQLTFTEEQVLEMEEDQEDHEFQAEVGRLMDIIINSLYQHKEVFLRELISNASDALDKVRFRAINEPDSLGDKKDLEIRLEYDSDAKTVTISDTGIGMSKQGLINNLGTIAKSGTTQFIEAVASGDNLNLIGQFGVGFYSAFLAANKVTVVSKADDDDQYIWESSAANSFTIAKDPRGNTLGRGTRITIHLKSDAYDFCDQDMIQKLAKKYSEFINFPIFLKKSKEVSKEVPVDETADDAEGEEGGGDDELDLEEDDDDDDFAMEDDEDAEEGEGEEEKAKTKTVRETVWEWERVNDVKAIWYRSKEDIEEEEYTNFYKSITKDYADPLSHIHFIAEGEVQFRSILYIPEHSAYDQFENYYGKSSALKLYVRRVLINDEFEDLMPRYLNFVKGIVDSDDLPLNVSREQLQQLKMIRVMSRKLVRKTIEMIKKLGEVKEEEEEPTDFEDEEYEDEYYDEADDDEDEEEDEEDWDDEYEDEFEEKTAEELKEEKELRQKKRQEKIENYERFWNEFGKNIKLGIIEDPGNRNKLAKLTRWHTSLDSTKLSSLDQYMDRMKENQEVIYVLSGESIESILESPNLQGLLKRGYEVVLLNDPIDEFVFQHLTEYEKTKISNVAKADFKMPDDDVEKRKLKKLKKMYQPLTNYLKDQLKEVCDSVMVSSKLVTDPVMVLAAESGYSAQMEKVTRAQAYSKSENRQLTYNQKKTFEINPHHPIIKEMLERVKDNPDDEDTAEMSSLLYETALLNSGYVLTNPAEYARNFYKIFNGALGIPRNAQVEEIEVDLDDEDEEFDEEELDEDDEFDEFNLDDEEEEEEEEEVAEPEVTEEAEPEVTEEAEPAQEEETEEQTEAKDDL